MSAKLLFAETEDKKIIYIDDIETSKRHFFCPYCNGTLIAKRGKIKMHHFAHKKESCFELTNTSFFSNAPFFEFLRLGLTNAQLKNLNEFYKNESFYMPASGYKNAYFWKSHNEKSENWNNYRVCKYFDFFIEQGFIVSIDNDCYEITPKTKVVLCHLTLKEYWKYTNNLFIFDNMKENDMLSLMVSRFKNYFLYFLKITTSKNTFYKIGITSREVKARVDEIRCFLRKKKYDVEKIDVLYYYKGMGAIESYFKAKYKKSNIATLGTEYYDFGNETILKNVTNELQKLYLCSDTHSTRIKEGIKKSKNRNHRGKGKVDFLDKPMSQKIIALLDKHTVRDIAKMCKCSTNTVLKVSKQIAVLTNNENAKKIFHQINAKKVSVIFYEKDFLKARIVSEEAKEMLNDADIYPIDVTFSNTNKSPIDAISSALEPFTNQEILSQFNEKESKEHIIWKQMKACEFGAKSFKPLLIFHEFEKYFKYTEEQKKECNLQLAELLNERLPDGIRSQILQERYKASKVTESYSFSILTLKMLFLIPSNKLYLMHEISQHIPQIFNNRYHLK